MVGYFTDYCINLSFLLMKKGFKYKIKAFYAVIGIALNLAIVFNLFANSLHESVTHHQHANEEICNSEFEKDACHRFLVHHEESASCNKEHKHISEKSEDCFVCQYFKERHNEINETVQFLSYFYPNNDLKFSFSELNLKSDFLLFSFVRGPPSHVS